MDKQRRSRSRPLAAPPEQPLGDLLVQEGLVTESELHAALRLQSELEAYKPIGQILVDQKTITQKQLDFVLDRHQKRSRLGETLVRSGAITKDQLDFAISQQPGTGLRLGEVLRQLNFVTDATIRQALCAHLNVPFVDLGRVAVDPSLVKLISKAYAHHHRIIPIARVGNILTVAMDDPTDVDAIEELQSSTGCLITVVSSTHEALMRALRTLYEDALTVPLEDIPRLELVTEEAQPERLTREYTLEARHADELVRWLIGLALQGRATDIHLETLDNRMQTRFRIDGVLQELNLGPLEESINASQREIISRIKILGNLDITERRRPQDGSFRARVAKGDQIIKVNLRVSIIPGYYGENVVLRILDPRNAPGSLEGLGFSSRVADQLRKLLQRTAGMVLLTGPTGSGKTTTLYAALMTIYRPGIRILTAEDPIEYVFEHFSQSEVSEKIGNTFASYMRAFLRHDPEVIMVGEIRDAETAEIAFRAAQTGHLILSTLHSTDAASAITRLLDLNVDRNLITSSLAGVMSQRLVRSICTACREPYVPNSEILREFFEEPPADGQWYRGRGCPHCHFTGYKGRMPVAELWVPSERDILLLNKGTAFEEIRASSSDTTIFMVEDLKDRMDKTTLEELIRTLPYRSIHQFRNLQASVASREHSSSARGSARSTRSAAPKASPPPFRRVIVYDFKGGQRPL